MIFLILEHLDHLDDCGNLFSHITNFNNEIIRISGYCICEKAATISKNARFYRKILQEQIASQHKQSLTQPSGHSGLVLIKILVK